MNQLGLGLNLSTKKTRKREFLKEMQRVVPWAALVQIIQPHYPKANCGRFAIEPDPALLPSENMPWPTKTPVSDECVDNVQMCGSCCLPADMSDGIYDDGEWTCGGCIALLIERATTERACRR